MENDIRKTLIVDSSENLQKFATERKSFRETLMAIVMMTVLAQAGRAGLEKEELYKKIHEFFEGDKDVQALWVTAGAMDVMFDLTPEELKVQEAVAMSQGSA